MTTAEPRTAERLEPGAEPPPAHQTAARSTSRPAGLAVRRRDVAVACTYALLAALAQLLLPFEPATRVLGMPVPGWTGLALQLTAAAALVLRTTRPWVVLLVTAPAAAASVGLDAGPVSALLLFEAIFTSVRYGSRRLHRLTSILCLGATAAALLAALALPEHRELWTQLVVMAGVVLILPLLWAGEVRGHQEARAQAERAAEAERETAARQLELEQARAALRLQEQRTHLAQELHDGVTGHLSAVALQTGALRSSSALRQDPAALERSLEVVRTSAVEAMADMRRLIDVLRTDEPADDDSASWDGLSARLRALRPEATIVVHPAATARLDAAGLSGQALRIGQEAVTNVLKHAGPGPASLLLTDDDGRVVLEIRSPLADHAVADDGSGIGLPSMLRRARETGGKLEAGPVDERTWHVRACWDAHTLASGTSEMAAGPTEPHRRAEEPAR
ncbi:hypothetical protein C884_00611 [Kocuria palustris PEL]|uniref:histidine kinase n=1 Tax=Kocuria palustris PEL TaxID=1236550 RepID=M2YCS1_9MICC|nr:histidine kinase [Kocuria palustris]EME36320.1 hypothetical protein C884_00611 [Kocuria palustris PEL]